MSRIATKTTAGQHADLVSARARFIGRLYGMTAPERRRLLGIETDAELVEIKHVALECQWFEIAAAVKIEQQRREREKGPLPLP